MEGEIDTGSLDLIVTHYREPWNVGKRLFDTIALQRAIDFENVGVILVNDGEENELPKECFEGYPFEVNQMSIPKGGVSRARNAGLDASGADWVMFCDFDDFFSSVFALHLIFRGMADGNTDLLRAEFTEETKDEKGAVHLVSHDDDTVFVHGKAMRRSFLTENGIRFHPELTIHEDAFFNVLAYSLAKEREQRITTPVYVWAWNGDSVVRRDREGDFLLNTYGHLIRQRIALTEEYLRREMQEEAEITVIKTVADAYYDFQQHEWRLPKYRDRKETAERWFCAYFKRYAAIYAKADVKRIGKLAAISRGRVVMNNTMVMESETLMEWLQHIMNDVKPIPPEEQRI